MHVKDAKKLIAAIERMALAQEEMNRLIGRVLDAAIGESNKPIRPLDVVERIPVKTKTCSADPDAIYLCQDEGTDFYHRQKAEDNWDPCDHRAAGGCWEDCPHGGGPIAGKEG